MWGLQLGVVTVKLCVVTVKLCVVTVKLGVVTEKLGVVTDEESVDRRSPPYCFVINKFHSSLWLSQGY
jgi:hypothetical protein